ncbi:hypothetical protein BH11MYX4_BH11MYX4_48650 [soil metagenome]
MRASWWLAGLVTMLGAAIAMPGCAADPGAGDEADGELAGGEADSSEDALTTQALTAYAPIAPPEHRVTTAAVSARVGAPLVAGRKVALIRSATFQGESTRLVIDEESFATSLVPAAALERASRQAASADRIAETPWSKSFAEFARRGAALEHLSAEADGLGADEPFALTVDMCQSRRPWERRLFDWAVGLSERIGQPVPVGIAMTGVWAKAHPAELDQLMTWERSGKLAITWINHSSTHPLHCLDASCRKAEFLTSASVDFEEEVLGEERAILARGMAPSALFRFPGLVHDAKRLGQLSRLSMMALDADGWIAKGQPIKRGAVVLVHGNGNEPEGIVGFLKQVQAPARAAALGSGKSKLVSPLLAAPSVPR